MSENYIEKFTKCLLTLKKLTKIFLKETLKIAFLSALFCGPFFYFSYLNSQGYEMDANAYLYTLSTIPQTIAALIGLFGIFIILKLKDYRKEDTLFRVIDIILLVFPFAFGIIAIVFSLMFLPFSNLKLNEIDFLSSIGLTPLEVVGIALVLCFAAVISMIKIIYVIIMGEMNNLIKEGQYKPPKLFG